MNLTEYMEAVFVSRYSYGIQADYNKTADLNDLAKSAEAVQTTKAPVMVVIRGETFTKEGDNVNSGYAVLGYDVVNISNTEGRLMIYAPNFPNTERYITLKKSGNNHAPWAYKMNDSYDRETGRTYESISVVATIKNGTVSTSNSDITPILTCGVTSDGTVPVRSASSMWLPDGQYTIQTTDSSGKELEATLADVNQSSAVSTAAKSVTFAVEDDKALNYVQIGQAGAEYDITLSSTLDQGHGDVQLTGTTASGGVSFAQISGSLYGTGVDSCHHVQSFVHGSTWTDRDVPEPEPRQMSAKRFSRP